MDYSILSWYFGMDFTDSVVSKVAHSGLTGVNSRELTYSAFLIFPRLMNPRKIAGCRHKPIYY